MTISNSHVLNCRVNAPGLWPLTISLGANSSILLQLGGGLYSKADSDFGATLVRNPSERDAAEQKPTPIRPGVWRELFWIAPQINVIHGMTKIGDNHWLGSTTYPSREAAELSAAKSIAGCISQGSPFDAGVEFIEARFFPADGEKP